MAWREDPELNVSEAGNLRHTSVVHAIIAGERPTSTPRNKWSEFVFLETFGSLTLNLTEFSYLNLTVMDPFHTHCCTK